ncbi:hypothetical protein FTX61_00395 [Nitriliruptoraceae bacterium ZYF776]|nr:hypothetical protein [Profundirhabdus halotolerans]
MLRSGSDGRREPDAAGGAGHHDGPAIEAAHGGLPRLGHGTPPAAAARHRGSRGVSDHQGAIVGGDV